MVERVVEGKEATRSMLMRSHHHAFQFVSIQFSGAALIEMFPSFIEEGLLLCWGERVLCSLRQFLFSFIGFRIAETSLTARSGQISCRASERSGTIARSAKPRSSRCSDANRLVAVPGWMLGGWVHVQWC